VVEVQRRCRNEFGTPSPTRVTIARLRDKFEVHVTVQNVNKGRSGRPRSSTVDGTGLHMIPEEVCKANIS